MDVREVGFRVFGKDCAGVRDAFGRAADDETGAADASRNPKKVPGRDRERIGADRVDGRRWKTLSRGGDRHARPSESRIGSARTAMRSGEHQALRRLVVQERLHRDARGFVVHQRIGLQLALERRHHARLEQVLQDVIGITLDSFGASSSAIADVYARAGRARSIPCRSATHSAPRERFHAAVLFLN